MLFNSTHKFTSILQPLTQEEIYNTPEFFGMSYAQIHDSGRCPPWLRRTLLDFPWDASRPNVIQVRPHDFRQGRPFILGDGAHVDANVRLNDGVERTARDMFDWRLMTVSFGDCVQTEFMVERFEGDLSPTSDHGAFFSRLPYATYRAPAPNQLAEYTSRDVHRAGRVRGPGTFRLMIVAFESSDITAGGIVLPSIRERDEAGGRPLAKIQDHLT